MQVKESASSEVYFDTTAKYAARIFAQKIVSEVKLLNCGSVLDVGCGTGYISKQISNCVACDLDLQRLDIARNHTKGCVPLMAASVTQLPFRDSSFDLVLATEVMEHVPDTRNMLEEIKRVSARYSLITVPNEPLFRIANICRGKHLAQFGNTEGHIHHWNKSTLHDLLCMHFSNVDVRTNSLVWLMAVCKK